MSPLPLRVGGERLGLLGGDEPDPDEVERADEVSGDREATGAGDGVTEPDRPPVLEEDECRGGVVRELPPLVH